MRTLLGWSLIGPVLPSAGKTLAVHYVTTAEVLEHNVKRLWQLDAIPPPNPSGVSMSKEDRYALSVMKQFKSKENATIKYHCLGDHTVIHCSKIIVN